MGTDAAAGTAGRREFRAAQSTGRASAVIARLLAFADLFEFGEHGLDVEFLAFFFGSGDRLGFRRGSRSGDLGRQQRRPGLVFGGLFLCSTMYLEIKINLGAKAKRYRIHGGEIRGVPMGPFADRLNGRFGGADEPHDLAVLQLRVVAHEPKDCVWAVLPAGDRGVARSLFALRFGQTNLRFGEAESIARVGLAFGKLVPGDLSGHDRIAPDNALSALIVCDGL